MSLVGSKNGIDLYRVPNGQWIISGMYPHYEELEHLYESLKHNPDVSTTTSTVHGKQTILPKDLWQEPRQKYQQWLKDAFKTTGANIKSISYRDFNDLNIEKDIQVDDTAWIIEYNEHGHQTGHFHSVDRLHQTNTRFASAVMFFDDIKPTQQYKCNGCLWTVLQEPNGYTWDHKFHPEPGRVVVMDDRVFHGAYPTTQKRRCLVWDFNFTIEE